MKRRVHSFVWGGLAFLVLLIVGISTAVSTSQFSNFAVYGVMGVMAFAFVSCLILDNNFVGEMVEEIFGWGFVRMPGLIFTLDLDGIIWLLTVKLLFWLIGILLAVLCGALAIALGLIVSVFVYPYAIRQNLKGN